MRAFAIIPARSGSKGLPNKNIRLLNGQPLISYSINFAKALNLDAVICSTDSVDYAKIAEKFGADVPELRSAQASTSNAMEDDVIDDLNSQFGRQKIEPPDIAVWLRPTFVFRSLEATKSAITNLAESECSASRVVTEVDPRLYSKTENYLEPFVQFGKASMVRRQGLSPLFHVFNVDVFRWPQGKCPADFLGNKIRFQIAPKICGFDIDNLEDFEIVEALISNNKFERFWNFQ